MKAWKCVRIIHFEPGKVYKKYIVHILFAPPKISLNSDYHNFKSLYHFELLARNLLFLFNISHCSIVPILYASAFKFLF